MGKALSARNASLGTDTMIAIAEGTGIVKRVVEYMRFFAHSSCGQSMSCKTGTATMSLLLDRIGCASYLSASYRAQF